MKPTNGKILLTKIDLKEPKKKKKSETNKLFNQETIYKVIITREFHHLNPLWTSSNFHAISTSIFIECVSAAFVPKSNERLLIL